MTAFTTLALTLQAVPSVDTSLAGGLGGTEGPDMTRYLLVCSALLLGIALLAYGFKRMIGSNLTAKAARRSLQIMDVLPMGGRKRLAVVRCYDRTFLLGMGEKELSLVAELDGVIEPEQAPVPSRADRAAFTDLLRKATARPPREEQHPAEPVGVRQRELVPVREADPVREANPVRKANSVPTPAEAPRSSGGGGAGWVG